MEPALSLAVVVGFAAIHAFAGGPRLQVFPRSAWLSFAGGVPPRARSAASAALFLPAG